MRLCLVSLFVEPKTEQKEVQRWPNDFSLLALRKLSGPEKKETPTPKLLVAVSCFSLLASDEKTLFRPKEAIATHQTSEAE